MLSTKNTKMFLALITLFLPIIWWAFKVENIDATDENTIMVSFSEDVNPEKTIDLKVIENTDSIVLSEADFGMANKVNVELGIPLNSNSIYTLISVLGTEGNITFELPESFNNLEILNEDINSEVAQYIEKIVVVDASNIEVYYYGDVEDIVELKLIKELKTDSEIVLDAKKVEVKLQDNLFAFRPYSLTVADIESTDGKNIAFEDAIIDFEAPEFLKEDTNDYLAEDDLTEGEINDLEKALDVLEEDIENTPEETSKTVVELSHSEDKDRLPDSWTKENILVIIALLIAFGIAYKNNKNNTLKA